MNHLNIPTYLDLGLRLGEGTGAVLLYPLIDASVRILTEMRTLKELAYQSDEIPRRPRLLHPAARRLRPAAPYIPGRDRVAACHWTYRRAARGAGCGPSDPAPALPARRVIGCLVWVFITGGLHLDGVADCGDGLLVEAPPERRLEIMKDSRLGTFGGAALFFVLALKATALCTLAASFDGSWSGLLTLAGACCMAGALARSMVFQAMHVPSARPGALARRA